MLDEPIKCEHCGEDAVGRDEIIIDDQDRTTMYFEGDYLVAVNDHTDDFFLTRCPRKLEALAKFIYAKLGYDIID